MPSKEYMLRFDANLLNHLNNVHKLLNEKHKKYGNGPIIKTGLSGIITKLDIKLERLRNLEVSLSKTSDDFREEMIEDCIEQLVDIVGYGILGMMWIKGELK